MAEVEPGEVWLESTPHRRVARWRQIRVPLWAVRWVTVVELRDGSDRWAVDLVDLIDRPARVYPGEALAYEAARRIMTWLAAQHPDSGWTQEDPNPTETARAQVSSPER